MLRLPYGTHLTRLMGAVVLVWNASPAWAAINLVLVLLQGVLPLAALYAMKQIIDTVSTGVAKGQATEMMWPLIGWIAVGGAVAVLMTLCRSLSELASEAQTHLVTDKVADQLHRHSAAVDLAYYEDARYYDTLHRTQHEAPYRPVPIVNNLLQIAQNGISLLGLAGILIAYNWMIAVVLLLVALPGAVVRLYFARRSYGLQQQQTEADRMSMYYHFMLTDASFAKELRLFQLGDLFRLRYSDLRLRLREAKIALSRRRMLTDLLTQGGASLAVFAALGFIALQALRGTITLGVMVMYYQGFQAGFGYFQALLRSMAGLYEHSLFLTNYQEFLALKPALIALPPEQTLPQVSTRGIRFHGVSFRYLNNPNYALEEIDLEIAPGQVIALVGGNGSGKTTLTKLLCRLYDPNEGVISLDGTDIRHFDPEAWRRQISVVFQDYVRYLLSARENIWLGNVAHPMQQEEIERAAIAAGIDGVIRRLPSGYDSLLGQVFFGGHELSIGEWQKVAVARSFLRTEARILIMDEPSSALDPLAEADLFSKLRALIGERSAVLVSHRFSTVQMADYIYVLDQGRIIERGTHLELLRLDGHYAHLYRVQAEHYQTVPESME